jgi:hypothetical protein
MRTVAFLLLLLSTTGLLTAVVATVAFFDSDVPERAQPMSVLLGAIALCGIGFAILSRGDKP